MRCWLHAIGGPSSVISGETLSRNRATSGEIGTVYIRRADSAPKNPANRPVELWERRELGRRRGTHRPCPGGGVRSPVGPHVNEEHPACGGLACGVGLKS